MMFLPASVALVAVFAYAKCPSPVEVHPLPPSKSRLVDLPAGQLLEAVLPHPRPITPINQLPILQLQQHGQVNRPLRQTMK
jgi:hypothetical protein